MLVGIVFGVVMIFCWKTICSKYKEEDSSLSAGVWYTSHVILYEAVICSQIIN